MEYGRRPKKINVNEQNRKQLLATYVDLYCHNLNIYKSSKNKSTSLKGKRHV